MQITTKITVTNKTMSPEHFEVLQRMLEADVVTAIEQKLNAHDAVGDHYSIQYDIVVAQPIAPTPEQVADKCVQDNPTSKISAIRQYRRMMQDFGLAGFVFLHDAKVAIEAAQDRR